MDVDADLGVGVFGEDARDEGYTERVELMGDAVNAEGEEAGIGDDDFLERLGGGVVAQVAGGVFVEPFAHTAKAAEKGLGLLFGLRIADQAGNVGVQLDGCVH